MGGSAREEPRGRVMAAESYFSRLLHPVRAWDRPPSCLQIAEGILTRSCPLVGLLKRPSWQDSTKWPPIAFKMAMGNKISNSGQSP